MNKIFSDTSWDEYVSWLTQDKKILKKINEILKDIDRNGNEGIGKPEPLKHELAGLWSRRINGEHRLVYKIEDNKIYVVNCKGHYK